MDDRTSRASSTRKRAQTTAKEQTGMEQAEGLLLDQDMGGLDEDSIRRILRLLVRAEIRHEQQMTILEADRSYIFFIETKDLGVVQMSV